MRGTVFVETRLCGLPRAGFGGRRPAEPAERPPVVSRRDRGQVADAHLARADRIARRVRARTIGAG